MNYWLLVIVDDYSGESKILTFESVDSLELWVNNIYNQNEYEGSYLVIHLIIDDNQITVVEGIPIAFSERKIIFPLMEDK